MRKYVSMKLENQSREDAGAWKQEKIFQPIVICIAQHGLSVPLKDNPSVTKDWLERYLLLVEQVILNESDA